MQTILCSIARELGGKTGYFSELILLMCGGMQVFRGHCIYWPSTHSIRKCAGKRWTISFSKKAALNGKYVELSVAYIHMYMCVHLQCVITYINC